MHCLYSMEIRLHDLAITSIEISSTQFVAIVFFMLIQGIKTETLKFSPLDNQQDD